MLMKTTISRSRKNKGYLTFHSKAKVGANALRSLLMAKRKRRARGAQANGFGRTCDRNFRQKKPSHWGWLGKRVTF